jgi:uncharacterized protein YaaQ
MSSVDVNSVIVAVVQEQDLDPVMRALATLGVPGVYMSSTGGFLGRRNATLLIGLPEAGAEQVLAVLRSTCRRRIEFMTMPVEGAPMPMPAPIPVTVGGASVFALPVERFEEL